MLTPLPASLIPSSIMQHTSVHVLDLYMSLLYYMYVAEGSIALINVR